MEDTIKIDNESWQRKAEWSMINWNYYRIEAAIAAMQAQLSSYETMRSIIEKLDKKGISRELIFDTVAQFSTLYADALITELKKGGDQ